MLRFFLLNVMGHPPQPSFLCVICLVVSKSTIYHVDSLNN